MSRQKSEYSNIFFLVTAYENTKMVGMHDLEVDSKNIHTLYQLLCLGFMIKKNIVALVQKKRM